VTGVLPGIQRYAEAHGVPSDRICYFPNGVDPASYPEPSPPPQGKPFLISYFGAHGPANDLGTVLEAAAIVQRSAGADAVRVRLVGDGSEKPALIRRSQDLGLRNTEFRAPVPKPQLAALAQESCAFVFHLRRLPVIERHGLSSNKLFDYLLAARPVIFACKSLNNPVGEAGAGLCADCENPQGIADAAVRLRSMSSDERWHMGTRGRQYVLAHHDLSKLAIRLQEFLAAILERHAKSRSGHCE
jgi:glycosyltransferase involved in cell wall biosynthesis